MNKENSKSNSSISLKRKTTEERSILGESSILNVQAKTSKPSKNSSTDIQKLEFEIENGDYVIYEYYNELTRQIQEAKEEQILKLEEKSEELIKQIEKYKKETTQNYFKNKLQLKEKFTEQSKNCNEISNLKYTLIQKSLFNDKFLIFQKNSIDCIGSLKENEINTIDAQTDLNKIATLNLPKSITKEKIVFLAAYKYFSNGEFLIAFSGISGILELNSRSFEQTLYFFVFNKDNTIKVTRRVPSMRQGDYIYVVNDKIVYQADVAVGGKIHVYDSNLKMQKTLIFKNYTDRTGEYDCDCEFNGENQDECNCNLNITQFCQSFYLIGACESGIYLLNSQDWSEYYCTDWKFDSLKELKLKFKNFETRLTRAQRFMRFHKGKYYFITNELDLVIWDESNKGRKIIPKKKYLRFEIDLNSNLILFDDKKQIEYRDLDGNLKFQLKLKNFKDYNDDEDNEDDDEDNDDSDNEDDEDEKCEYLYTAFSLNTNNELCFIDRNSLTLNQVKYYKFDLNI